MPCEDLTAEDRPAVRFDDSAIHLSLELSRKSWVVTGLLPATQGKLSRHTLKAWDLAGLLVLVEGFVDKVRRRTGETPRVVTIQEAGLDGFWLHRALQAKGIESHVVEPASIPMPRKARRAKTDRIDGECLMRSLLAWLRGEPRVCAMVHPPAPQAEDERQLSRERGQLVTERTRHTNRIKGLLFAQGISGFEPLRRRTRKQLDELVTGDGRPLPMHLKDRIGRELDLLDLLADQIATVEAELVAVIAAQAAAHPGTAALTSLKAIGDKAAGLLITEAFNRDFQNRRQLAAYAGLCPTPFQSGGVNREQGISKSGNPRLRALMVEVAWLWRVHQPQSALTQWFIQRTRNASPGGRKAMLTAMARKLLVALWRFHTTGEIPEGAVLSPVG